MLRAESAEERRVVGTANGTLAMDEPPAPRPPPAAPCCTPQGTQRRVDAARAAAAQRVPRGPALAGQPVGRSRILAALVVAALGVALVILVQMVT